MAVFKSKFVPDIIQTLVESIQTGDEGLELPVFDYGTWNEQSNIISINGQSGKSSFPLVFMPVSYDNDINEEPIYYSDTDLTLFIIMAFSNEDKRSKDQFADIFKATLYPIYDNLINAMMTSTSFDKQGKRFIKHRQRDLYHYNAEVNENVLNQPIDAIRLDFTDLKINFTSECK